MPVFLLGASIALANPSLISRALRTRTGRGLVNQVSTGRGLVNIYGMDDRELEALLKSLGAPRFRAKQIKEWVYDRNIHEFDEMFNLPKKLRHQLQVSAQDHSLLCPTGQVSCDFEWRGAAGCCARGRYGG